MNDETPDETAAIDTAWPDAPEPGVEASVPFWQRPTVKRYLVPLVTPIAVVFGVVVFVLNLSRVFLASHGHISVVVGTVVLVAILLGASVILNRPGFDGGSGYWIPSVSLVVASPA